MRLGLISLHLQTNSALFHPHSPTYCTYRYWLWVVRQYSKWSRTTNTKHTHIHAHTHTQIHYLRHLMHQYHWILAGIDHQHEHEAVGLAVFWWGTRTTFNCRRNCTFLHCQFQHKCNTNHLIHHTQIYGCINPLESSYLLTFCNISQFQQLVVVVTLSRKQYCEVLGCLFVARWCTI